MVHLTNSLHGFFLMIGGLTHIQTFCPSSSGGPLSTQILLQAFFSQCWHTSFQVVSELVMHMLYACYLLAKLHLIQFERYLWYNIYVYILDNFHFTSAVTRICVIEWSWVHSNTTGNTRFFLYLNTKQILLLLVKICCLYSPKFINSHQCSYSYTVVNVIVHIKSAINVYTVVANINVTVHIK